MFHGHLEHFRKPPLEGGPDTKPEDHNTPNAHNRGFIFIIICEDPHEIGIWLRPCHIWLQTTLKGPWPYYMSLEVCWDGLWTLSFGLSQSHGHSSWLVCKVAFSLVFLDNTSLGIQVPFKLKVSLFLELNPTGLISGLSNPFPKSTD